MSPSCFLLFLGRGRSGSSLCGGLLASHPNIILPNQKEFKNFEFTDENELYQMLLDSSYRKKWIWEPLRKFSIWKDMKEYDDIRVIGSKKQGTLITKANDFSKLDELKNKITIPIKFIHVYRNPFDNIATIFTKSQWTKHIKRGTNMKSLGKAITYHFHGMEVTQSVINRGESVLNVKHEDLINNTEKIFKTICNFLDVPVVQKHFNFFKSIIWEKPRQTRNNVIWTSDQIIRVNNLKNKYEFLKEYEMGDF